jgi:serine/threonine protein kinase
VSIIRYSYDFLKMCREKKYVAIKVLKGYATSLVQKDIMWELAAFELLSAPSPASGLESNHCLRLISHFMHMGNVQDGEHLCLVTDVMGGDVRSLMRDTVAKHNAMPLPLAKRILLHTLRGIAYMHRCGVVHTDLKSDNIMFDTSCTTTNDFAALVAADPPRLNPPEDSWEGTVQTAVSQPLPLPSLSDTMARTFQVADFGSGR